MTIEDALDKKNEVEAALIDEGGVQFAVVIIKRDILLKATYQQREMLRTQLGNIFPSGIEIILTARDFHGVPTYHGRKDIVNFLAEKDYKRLAYNVYKIN
ncbi:MAG: hypothetical protein ACRCVN_02790 [Spirochaetia bacterium]